MACSRALVEYYYIRILDNLCIFAKYSKEIDGIMRYYNNYLNNRLKQKKAFPTDIDRGVINAIDLNGATGKFEILIFIKDECYFVSCESDENSKRYIVTDLKCFSHKLPSLFADASIPHEEYKYAFHDKEGRIEYDEFYSQLYPELRDYNKRIEGALQQINFYPGNTLYIYGDFIDENSLRYALQKKFGDIHPVRKENTVNLKSRLMFSPEATKEPLKINVPATVVNYLGSKYLEIYVPKDAETLGSIFWKDTTWGKIIPNDCLTVEISNIPCNYVRISFEIDGTNNIFCRADDGCGHIAYTLINAPWGKPEYRDVYGSLEGKGGNGGLGGLGGLEGLEGNGGLGGNRGLEGNRGLGGNGGLEGKEDKKEKEEKNEVVSGKAQNESQTITINIPQDRILTYTDIFTERFVKDTEEIKIVDSYLYLWHQINNVRDFVRAVITVNQESGSGTKLKKVSLETRKAEDIILARKKKNNKGYKPDEDGLKEIKEANKRQIEGLSRLKKLMNQIGIELDYSFREFHDRKIYFSNGWMVEAGRGLDIFQKRNNELEPQKCKDCTFTFKYGQEEQHIARKTRNLDYDKS